MKNSVTILGSSSALPTSKRFPSAQVLRMLERFFLIDCGEGTQIQLRRAAVSFEKIKAICISHLHGDHYLGIFGVISTFNLLGRRAPLTIFAPKDLQKIIQFQLAYLTQELTFPMHFVALSPKKDFYEIYSDKKLQIFAISLQHRVDTWGFLFTEKEKPLNVKKEAIKTYNLSIADIVKAKKGENIQLQNGEVVQNNLITSLPDPPKSYAYISDTIFSPSVAQYLQGVTLLYHEATFAQNLQHRATITMHSTAMQAAEFATLCKAEQLLIGHFSARYNSTEILEQEAKTIFENTIAVQDLQSYEF